MEQQPHHRQAPSRRMQPTMQTQQRQDEILQWERDWRESITKSLETTAQLANDTVGVVREMQNDVKELMEWRAGLEKRRNDRDDKRRELTRTDVALGLMGLTIIINLLWNHLGWH